MRKFKRESEMIHAYIVPPAGGRSGLEKCEEFRHRGLRFCELAAISYENLSSIQFFGLREADQTAGSSGSRGQDFFERGVLASDARALLSTRC